MKEGYEIGLLGYNYKDYTDLKDEEIKKDIAKAQEVFKKLNVDHIEVLRAPTGHFDKRLLKISENFGLTVVHWSVDSKDWTNPGVNQIVKNTLKHKKGISFCFTLLTLPNKPTRLYLKFSMSFAIEI